jgi:mannose-6-phosphate isomerase
MVTQDPTAPQAQAPPPRLAVLRDRLVTWLIDDAYPLWACHGVDSDDGGFIETLAQNGAALAHPRRARVQPRQIYSFAQAPGLGWQGDARGILERGMDYFHSHYRRPDGMFRTLVAADGTPLDDHALLYDQSFVLLGYAAAAAALDARREFEAHALALRECIESHFGAADGAFHSAETRQEPFASNPHMHLLEACLAWAEVGADPGWAAWAANLATLAMRRFIRSGSGALGEFFAADWQPAPGVSGRVIEPGHQFEWAWLLLRSPHGGSRPVRDAALRLIAIGESAGVHNQVAVNALLDDFSVHDGNARLWPQTERLKAALLAARLTGEERYWAMATAAAGSLLPYLDTPVAGLWLDVQLPSGELVDSPAPASSFYHLVCAIAALNTTLATA